MSENTASREAILAIDDSNVEQVVVPEWNGVTIKVRSLTGHERDQLEASMIGKNGKADTARGLKNFRARLVVATVVDDNGAPMFTAADIDALAGKSAAALDRISTVAMRLSGLSSEDVTELAGE